MRSDALSHVRVLDFSRVLAGSWPSQVLSDLGAEVIKVERPGAGDETRACDAQGAETRESAYFASTNRGKKSITLDLAHREGQAIVRRLARRRARRAPRRAPPRARPNELRWRERRAA